METKDKAWKTLINEFSANIGGVSHEGTVRINFDDHDSYQRVYDALLDLDMKFEDFCDETDMSEEIYAIWFDLDFLATRCEGTTVWNFWHYLEDLMEDQIELLG